MSRMSARFRALIVSIGLLLAAMPLLAHHSIWSEFDIDAQVELTGAVTKIEWLNPHIWSFMDVTDDAGTVTNWGLEMGAPSTLVRAGWSRRTMTIGDRIAVEGNRARDKSNNAKVFVVILTSTGQRLFASAADPGAVLRRDAAREKRRR